MTFFGIIMILAAVQLIIIGAMIQRGKESYIIEKWKKGVSDIPMFCRYFGNRLILLGLIAIACAVISFNTKSGIFIPMIFFGLGMCMVMILMLMDRKKFTKN